MQFHKGQSGNPAGRKRGSKNTLTLMREVLLEGEAEAIMRRAIDGGLNGEELPLRLSPAPADSLQSAGEACGAPVS
jgi:hypothetical protein